MNNKKNKKLKIEKYNFKTTIDILGVNIDILIVNEKTFTKEVNKTTLKDPEFYNGFYDIYNKKIVGLVHTGNKNKMREFDIPKMMEILVHEIGHVFQENGVFSGAEWEEVLAESCTLTYRYHDKFKKIEKEIIEYNKQFILNDKKMSKNKKKNL